MLRTSGEPRASDVAILCRSCWRASIMEDRKTKVSRLKNYRKRHPQRPTKQCNGKTWR